MYCDVRHAYVLFRIVSMHVCSRSLHLLQRSLLQFAVMGRHLTPKEIDTMFAWKSAGFDPMTIHAKLSRIRRRKRQQAPSLSSVRRALKSSTFKRGASETRGRKQKLSMRNLKALEKARVELIKKADGLHEVHWDDIMKKARVPPVHRTTAAKAMAKAGFNVKWRTPRLKPMRNDIDEAERRRICKTLRKLPASYWRRRVHLFMDNKKWDIPQSAKGKRFLRMIKVRGHLRTPSEGLKKGFTKPNTKKHHVNTGGHVNVCAGIIGCKVRIWHYLPPRWSGEAAENLYRNVVHKALRKHHPGKRKYIILEDNDPTGYKSNRARKAKVELGIVPLPFPTYSPDLNPLDYALWDEVDRRMQKPGARGQESAGQYMARLRRTALSIPQVIIKKMLSDMKLRTESVYVNHGGHIPRD